MKRQLFTWGSSPYQIDRGEAWMEWLSFLGLLLGALILFGVNLGNLPLRDWDEATIAQVAKEISQAPEGSLRWLFPTLWDQPYFNKPPLIHSLIAWVYSWGGIKEWSSRLFPAILTAFSVPLLYLVGRELFPRRLPAILSALVYLTLLPVVRHGRLTMLDGPILCFGLLMFWSVLRSRRDWRWSLGIGIGLALIGLTKGMMAVLLGAIAIIFLAWDTPRLLTSFYWWIGLILGSLPAFSWYLLQWFHYREVFVKNSIFNQSLQRIWDGVEGNTGPVWYYGLEILKYSWPWLMFSVFGLRLAWLHRNWSWGKFILVGTGVYFTVVSLMMTKLPWYIMPIYPFLALAAGLQLAELKDQPSDRPYPRFWLGMLGFLTLVATTGFIYFGLVSFSDHSLMFVSGVLAITLGVSAYLIAYKDVQFIAVLLWGMYVCLLLFVSSPHWVWELNEAFPVKPVAAMIKLNSPDNQIIYTSFAYSRPSLNFYSYRQVIALPLEELQRLWQELDQPYFLLDKEAFNSLNLDSLEVKETLPPQWVLVTKLS
jgi:4-amino-4-deoxy-L-arabinose transferase-like glycosyltransferase